MKNWQKFWLTIKIGEFKYMRKLFFALSILVLLFAIYIIIINLNNYADIRLLSGTGGGGIRVSLFTSFILASGLFVGAGTVYMFLDAEKEKVKIYQRELEKTSISGSDSASKVEVLEAKIKTLEKAFNTVIDERTQLELQIKSLNTELDKLIDKDK